MQFGMAKWLDAVDAEQAELEREMNSLRRFARTSEQNEALDQILDQAKQVRTRINFRRLKIAKMGMMVG